MTKSTKKTLTALATIIGGYILVGSISACNNVNIITGILTFTIIVFLIIAIIKGMKIFSDKDKLYDFFN